MPITPRYMPLRSHGRRATLFYLPSHIRNAHKSPMPIRIGCLWTTTINFPKQADSSGTLMVKILCGVAVLQTTTIDAGDDLLQYEWEWMSGHQHNCQSHRRNYASTLNFATAIIIQDQTQKYNPVEAATLNSPSPSHATPCLVMITTTFITKLRN